MNVPLATSRIRLSTPRLAVGGRTPYDKEDIEALEIDLSCAVSLVTGQLHATGHSALAEQVKENLQRAVEQCMERFSL